MPDSAFNLAQVLWDERAALEGQQLPSALPANGENSRIAPLDKFFAALTRDDLAATYPQLNADNRWALCLQAVESEARRLH